jgi:rhamnosyltransferase
MATLPAVFERLRPPGGPDAVETVAVDSGSTDGTLELLRRRADRVLTVPPERFDHGLTRNLGIEACRGELVVLLVQDAVPASDGWLAALTGPLREDAGLAGTYGRQLPRPDAGAITRFYLSRHAASSPAGRVTAIGGHEAFARLDPAARLALCAFDNVCACVRRSVWQAHPFQPTPIAEDVEWAREVLLAGYRLAYVPEAAVVHSHERSVAYEFRRTYLVHRRLRALFGLRTVAGWSHLPLAMGATAARHVRCLAAGPRGPRSWPAEVARALALAVAWPLAQHLGARSADRTPGREVPSPGARAPARGPEAGGEAGGRSGRRRSPPR